MLSGFTVVLSRKCRIWPVPAKAVSGNSLRPRTKSSIETCLHAACVPMIHSPRPSPSISAHGTDDALVCLFWRWLPRRLLHKHAITVRIEPVILLDCMSVRLEHAAGASECANQHQQSRLRQMEVGQ